MHDTYFDTPDFALTTNDTWFRKRDGTFEMKVPLHERGSVTTRVSSHFNELTTEDDIKHALGITQSAPLANCLTTLGYVEVASIETDRSVYEMDGFTIDVDTVDGYEIVEIEKMVAQQKDVVSAEHAIVSFAVARGLVPGPARAKVFEHIRRRNPAHFKKLVDAGLIDG